jgi:hypothetical protein
MDRSHINRSAWVLPSLSWSAVTKARARLKNAVAHVPSHIGDIKLQSLSRELLSWWLDARQGRAMPMPDSVDPRVLVELMPYFRMMRWEDDGRLIFRLYGSALVEATGFDLTGYPCIAPEDYEGKADDIARLKLLHAHPCGLLMHRDLHRTDGTTYTCEFMTLPVAGGDDGKNRIVGTVLPCVEVDEHRLDFTLSVPLTLRRAVFLDIGYGLPDEAADLSL